MTGHGAGGGGSVEPEPLVEDAPDRPPDEIGASSPVTSSRVFAGSNRSHDAETASKPDASVTHPRARVLRP